MVSPNRFFVQGQRAMSWRRGSSTLELVLILPILLMLSFGVVDYGYFFFVKNTLQGAAEAGVRAAISPTATNAGVTTVVGSMMTAAGLRNSGYTITLNPSDISTAVTITWGNVSFKTLAAGYGGISNSKPVIGAAVMIKESS
jgi:Flp pilus assembly protein TadG